MIRINIASDWSIILLLKSKNVCSLSIVNIFQISIRVVWYPCCLSIDSQFGSIFISGISFPNLRTEESLPPESSENLKVSWTPPRWIFLGAGAVCYYFILLNRMIIPSVFMRCTWHTEQMDDHGEPSWFLSRSKFEAFWNRAMGPTTNQLIWN